MRHGFRARSRRTVALGSPLMETPTLYSDDDLVMISALQHYLFCPRQCALIHVEQIWSENALTAEGRILHEHVDQPGHEARGPSYTATAVRLVSRTLGLSGVADMLEFHQVDSPVDENRTPIATPLKGRSLYWIPFPIEYKHGKPKEHQADEIQLCAQALCLEEMLSISIRKGALFYGKTRRRLDVEFTDELRALTTDIAHRVHRLIQSGITPPASYHAGCPSCSLFEDCRPREFTHGFPVQQWIKDHIQQALSNS